MSRVSYVTNTSEVVKHKGDNDSCHAPPKQSVGLVLGFREYGHGTALADQTRPRHGSGTLAFGACLRCMTLCTRPRPVENGKELRGLLLFQGPLGVFYVLSHLFQIVSLGGAAVARRGGEGCAEGAGGDGGGAACPGHRGRGGHPREGAPRI
eukprot:1175710-Prorocentrum_minimum.AAC.2